MVCRARRLTHALLKVQMVSLLTFMLLFHDPPATPQAARLQWSWLVVTMLPILPVIAMLSWRLARIRFGAPGSVSSARPSELLVIRLDRGYRLSWANAGFRRFVGSSVSELSGRTLLSLIHAQDHAQMLLALSSADSAPEERMIEARVKTPQGWRWVAWMGLVAHDADAGVEMQAVGQDITALCEACEAAGASAP